MKNLQKIIIVSFALLTVAILLAAGSMAVFVPGSSLGKTIMIILLVSMSPLPIVISVVVTRALSAYTKQSEQFATRDPLTGLYNQSTFWEFLGYEIERSRRQDYRFTILHVDLDNFKVINDTHGHEAGDAYLIEFSSLFKTAIRKGDIAARHGGDNFTAILPICDEAQAYIVAKRLLDSLREQSFLLPDGTAARITASIGMAVFPDHAKDAENLFLLADSMLHQAKVSGKDRVSLPGDEADVNLLKSAGAKSLFIMDSIRKKRIVPYFQPIVDVKDQKILAYEVLTRIVTPERVIPAAEFIEAAEGMGAIGKIDQMLIEQAFDVVKRSAYHGKLFLNLSPKVLVLKEFMPGVRKMMLDYGIDPSQLVFEITERDTVKNMDTIEKAVHELKDQGFQFAIDDFGAGYSSFQYIRMFKVDFLKIDGIFIKEMTGNSGMENAIVSNIANLARDLGIKTIAEFVESKSSLGLVESAGVDYAQGYFIQHPRPDLSSTGA